VKDPLLSLAPSELRALATSVRNRRVSPPYSVLGLQRIVGQDAAGSISGKLDTSPHLACPRRRCLFALNLRPTRSVAVLHLKTSSI